MIKLSKELIRIVYTKDLAHLAMYSGSEELKSGIDSDGRTALMYAILAHDCSLSMIETLISYGANVNIRDKGQSWSALSFAARDCGPDVCRALLDAGADVDSKDVFGNTPLIRAIMAAKEENVNLLVSYGANPDIENSSGITPRQLCETIGKHYFEATG